MRATPRHSQEVAVLPESLKVGLYKPKEKMATTKIAGSVGGGDAEGFHFAVEVGALEA